MIQDILSYLGLSHNPFPVALDPNNYYQTEASKIFLEELMHGIESRKGFLVLIGDVGVGKTSLSLQLLRLLEEKAIATAWVFNTVFSKDELFQSILKDWGIEISPEASGPALLDAVHEFLLKRNKAGENCVIIIDEAHNLDPACLEGLRMLSNLEFNGQKLVQILLIGQDELRLALDDHRMRQLKSRIAIYLDLPHLTREEVMGYVNFKLAKADSQLRLNKACLNILWRASGGNLRRVNIIMERVLYACITLRSNQITNKAVKLAVNDVAVHQKEVARGMKRRRLSWALAACLVIGLVGGATVAWLHSHGQFGSDTTEAVAALFASKPEPASAPSPTPTTEPASTPTSPTETKHKPKPADEQQDELKTPQPEPAPLEDTTPAPIAAVEDKPGPAQSAAPASDSALAPASDTTADTASGTAPNPELFAAPLKSLGLESLTEKTLQAAEAGDPDRLAGVLPEGFTAFTTFENPGQGAEWCVLPWREVAGSGPDFMVVWKTDTDFSSVFPGSKGRTVRALQKILSGAGLYNGPLDGIYGKKAWYGLAGFQKEHGLPATGLPDAATMFALERTRSDKN